MKCSFGPIVSTIFLEICILQFFTGFAKFRHQRQEQWKKVFHFKEPNHWTTDTSTFLLIIIMYLLILPLWVKWLYDTVAKFWLSFTNHSPLKLQRNFRAQLKNWTPNIVLRVFLRGPFFIWSLLSYYQHMFSLYNDTRHFYIIG